MARQRAFLFCRYQILKDDAAIRPSDEWKLLEELTWLQLKPAVLVLVRRQLGMLAAVIVGRWLWPDGEPVRA